ncbi:unnamed protein product, partial [Darwinula stevensoni]
RVGPSYTIDTLKALRQEIGLTTSIVYLIGADQLVNLSTWKDYQHLTQYAHLVVCLRPPFSLDHLNPSVSGLLANHQISRHILNSDSPAVCRWASLIGCPSFENLQKVIVNALENIKAQDIVVFDTTHLTSLFDRVIIATASSNRQTRALADSVHKDVKAAGGEIIATEGLETGEWVLVDCAIAVVHIMQAPIRQYYNLEEIWGEKTVDVYAKPAKKATKKTATQQDDVAKKTTKPRQAAITKTQSAQPTK